MSSIKSVCAAGVAIVATLTVVSCSSSGSGTESTSGAVAGPSTSSSAPPPSTEGSTSSAGTSSTPAAGSLTGNWAGSYHGAFDGTFTLHWTQTGTKLAGSIDLSTAGMVPLHGTVTNGQINFGTVGSTVITYTGTVSGDSMSGNYQVAGGTGGTGSWSAHKS
jgi:hypothetical protein